MSNSNNTRRKLFMHSAHKTVGVAIGLHAGDPPDFAVADHLPTVLNVCLVAESPTPVSDQTLGRLQQYLCKQHDVRCIRAGRELDEALPLGVGPEQIDCTVVFAREIPHGMDRIDAPGRYSRWGGGLVVVQAVGPLESNRKNVLDDDPDGGDRPTEAVLVHPAGHHPILHGVHPFAACIPALQSNLALGATVLLEGVVAGRRVPLAWTGRSSTPRRFETVLGSPADFAEPSFLRLLGNAVAWAGGRSTDSPRD